MFISALTEKKIWNFRDHLVLKYTVLIGHILISNFRSSYVGRLLQADHSSRITIFLTDIFHMYKVKVSETTTLSSGKKLHRFIRKTLSKRGKLSWNWAACIMTVVGMRRMSGRSERDDIERVKLSSDFPANNSERGCFCWYIWSSSSNFQFTVDRRLMKTGKSGSELAGHGQRV